MKSLASLYANPCWSLNICITYFQCIALDLLLAHITAPTNTLTKADRIEAVYFQKRNETLLKTHPARFIYALEIKHC